MTSSRPNGRTQTLPRARATARTAAVILSITAVVLLGACSKSSQDQAAVTSDGFTIEPVGEVGPDAFTPPFAVEAGICDKAQFVRDLQARPDAYREWAQVLAIQADQVAAYIETLTPIVLTSDTKVVNHGLRDGKAYPRNSLLPAGTAVLVSTRSTESLENPTSTTSTSPPTSTTSTTRPTSTTSTTSTTTPTSATSTTAGSGTTQPGIGVPVTRCKCGNPLLPAGGSAVPGSTQPGSTAPGATIPGSSTTQTTKRPGSTTTTSTPTSSSSSTPPSSVTTSTTMPPSTTTTTPASSTTKTVVSTTTTKVVNPGPY